jgi:hypothetical protein
MKIVDLNMYYIQAQNLILQTILGRSHFNLSIIELNNVNVFCRCY